MPIAVMGTRQLPMHSGFSLFHISGLPRISSLAPSGSIWETKDGQLAPKRRIVVLLQRLNWNAVSVWCSAAHAAKISNCSARDGLGLKANLACRLRII